jgi:hypothetical protein
MSLLEALTKGLVVKIGSDLSGLKSGVIESMDELNKLNKETEKSSQSYKALGMAVGTAATSAGVAIIGLTDSAKATNAELAGTAITLGTTTESMRNLALATSDAGFPMEDTIATFDLLARAGVRGDDQLQSIASSMDTLGDATGNSAASVTSSLIPALNAFDIPLTKVNEHIDGLTYLTKNSTIDLQDFTGTMSALGPKLNDLGLSLEDSEAIMLALSKAGYQGAAATRMFRSAVSESKGDVDTLYTSLGLTKETVAGYKSEIDRATGSSEKYAAAAETSIGTMDRLKSGFDEFKLSVGSSLEPLDGLGAILATSGPLILGLTQIPQLLTGIKLGLTILSAHPIILVLVVVIASLVLLEAKFGLVSKAVAVLGEGFDWICGAIGEFVNWVSTAVDWSDVLYDAFLILLGPIGWVQLAMDALGIGWDDVWDGMIGTMSWSVNLVIDAINAMIEGLNTVTSFGGLGGDTFDVPTIPRLATGGIVTQPTIAMIGEAGPEAVIPLSGSNAAGGVTITGNTFNVRDGQDIKKIAIELNTLITQRNRGRGQSS